MELAALPGNSVRGWHVVFRHTSGLVNHTNSKIGVIWSLASTGIAAGDRQRTRHPIVKGFTVYGARWKSGASELLSVHGFHFLQLLHPDEFFWDALCIYATPTFPTINNTHQLEDLL